ncbi:threonine aldolase family protein [Ottowia thiooxydans]|uniref:threonine aldolase family protein n=1 Tax=Ottowia thiooxydans TaxID=219182 RepID=UPI0004202533|nr:GntG family PLP-dependent aldolase [Ottowia thiooxydans]
MIAAILAAMISQTTSHQGVQAHAEDAPGPFTDLRSDTVTLPTAAMYERMRHAALGDDGLDGDPTARELEALAARTFGKEAGLYVPTATMGNLLAVLTQVPRQGQVAMEATAHMFLTERGGATLGAVAYLGIPGTAGEMDLSGLKQALLRSNALRTELVCMETTHVNAGGAVLSLAHMRAVRDLAHGAGARVHIDGARIFNAAVALQVAPDAVAGFADTVSICLSKGLSAPAGAVLVGPAETLSRARQLRKMLGGTQRQIGILAATGLEAIETMPKRLAQDHAMANQLGAALRAVLPDQIGLTGPATNIIFVELPDDVPESAAWARELQKHGVLIRPWGQRRIRLVTHRHINSASIAAAAAGFEKAASELLG